jgi:ABC-type nitrate/sulfonate/bicarbonate transport system ATPase subunit
VIPPPRVQLDHLGYVFGGKGRPVVEALRGVTLSVAPGEFASVVGPSGCGKSTLLRLLAGLLVPSSGSACVEGVDGGKLLGASGYMPQRDLLMPWRTVLDNVIVPLEFAGQPRRQARARAQALLPVFGLEDFAQAYPTALSGGMRQRASLLRTVLAGHRLLLLDEPFGALDAITRADLHEWLAGVLAGLGATVILVTHDLEEAVYLSDRVYVMTGRPGHIAAAMPVPLPRPRSYEITVSPAFAALKGDLLASLRAARRPLAAVTEAGP